MYTIIDGAAGEGGGSIVRLSMALSSLTKKPITIKNIRANRPNSGLRAQHLVGIETINKIYNGDLSTADIGSTTVSYKPNQVSLDNKEFIIEIQTAGSIALVIQAVRLALVNTKTSVKLIFKGGATYGLGAPSIDYLINVTEPALNLFGYESKIRIVKNGFYPKGGAEVIMEINPKKTIINGQMITNLVKCKRVKDIRGISIASESLQKAKVANRQRESAIQILKNSFPDTDINIDTLYTPSLSHGSGITLWTESEEKYIPPIGQSIIGKKSFPAEKVGKMAALGIVNSYKSFSVIDEYLADQLLPYAALNAPFSFSTPVISSHTKTNISLIEEFISVKFSYESEDMKKIIHVSPI
jgi:RNA 3'-terminal phosphate cyclase (ATP)/RNA 3'-terminal phosphate cyclase (GTP)